ncbi:MAG: class I SAM-dependent methyltransferase [Verrucomicrobia bacterium]|nr:class I SAM-dependent methyltransferase [Verrucomicrobiota bacterium]MDA1085404.1 class I SAM-dependent methyltransferase [Verrucomicrobiota bacterium]
MTQHASHTSPASHGCALCGGNDLVPLYHALHRAIGYAFGRCRSCGLIQHVEKTGSFADAFYKNTYHDLPHKTDEPANRVAMFERILDHIEKRTGSGRLLDVGCGPGHFVAQACERGWNAEGLEPSTSAVERGRARQGIAIYQGTLTGDHALPGDLYNCVTFWNVIDQIYDPLETLVAARAHMVEGGIVAVRVPNGTVHHMLRAAVALAPGLARRFRLADMFSVHPYSFTAETLRVLLDKAGYEDVEVRNSPLSGGDPSGRRSRPGAVLVSLMKSTAAGVAALISGITGARVLLAPSLIAVARKPL